MIHQVQTKLQNLRREANENRTNGEFGKGYRYAMMMYHKGAIDSLSVWLETDEIAATAARNEAHFLAFDYQRGMLK